MSYLDTWLELRDETKESKKTTLEIMIKDLEESGEISEEELSKIKDLKELYLQTHDFATRVGTHITTIAETVLSRCKRH